MEKIPRHILYCIGGPMRTGKTILAQSVLRRRRVALINTDTIRFANRSVLLGKPHASVRTISFRCDAIVVPRKGKRARKETFVRKNWSEDDLAWEGALGFIEAYDTANRVDVLVEGIAVTPERVRRLKLRNLSTRAVFIGYESDAHAKSICSHAERKKDWVYTWIQEGGDRGDIANWVRDGIATSVRIKRAARRFGYGYFDLTERPFKSHIRTAIDYLLGS